MTDGRKGYDPKRVPAGANIALFEDGLVAARKLEAQQAGRVLGLGGSLFLDRPDGNLSSDRDTTELLGQALRRIAPELVLLPHLGDNHADHWATVQSFVHIANHIGLSPLLPCWGYEVWSPLVANAFVDITEVMPLKQAAMMTYRSQIGDVDYPRAISGLNAFRSLAAGYSSGYAEAFFVDTLAGYTSLLNDAGPTKTAPQK